MDKTSNSLTIEKIEVSKPCTILINPSLGPRWMASDGLFTWCEVWTRSEREKRSFSPILASLVSSTAGALKDAILSQFPLHDALLSKIIADYSSLLRATLEKALEPYLAANDGHEENEAERGGELLMQILRADEAEKRRIARELHDGIGQALTTAIFSLDMLLANVPSEPAKIRQVVEEARSTIRESAQTLHDIGFRLRPPMLEDLGLMATLQWFFRSSRLQDKVDLTWEATGLEDRLPPDIETALFRIVQEATNNIMKHSSASEVEVRLDAGDGWAHLHIRDNGVGFDPELVNQCRGFSAGLRGMKERAELLGGHLEVKSRPGLGTSLRVFLPLRHNGKRGED